MRGMGFPEETSASAWKTANAADLEQQYDDVLEEGFDLYAPMVLQLGAVRADVLAEIVPTEDEVLRHTSTQQRTNSSGARSVRSKYTGGVLCSCSPCFLTHVATWLRSLTTARSR
jgi:hypothetical protein